MPKMKGYVGVLSQWVKYRFPGDPSLRRRGAAGARHAVPAAFQPCSRDRGRRGTAGLVLFFPTLFHTDTQQTQSPLPQNEKKVRVREPSHFVPAATSARLARDVPSRWVIAKARCSRHVHTALHTCGILIGLAFSLVWVGSAWAGAIRIIPDDPAYIAKSFGKPDATTSKHKASSSEKEPPRGAEASLTEPPPPVPTEAQPTLDPLRNAAREEEQRMVGVVQLVNRDEAREWLGSFISGRPLNCPLPQRDQWIDAIIHAVYQNDLPLCKEILGLTACIISIESGFHVDPRAVDPSGNQTMADLLNRAEQELVHKMGPLLSVPPIPTLYDQYKARYFPKLLECRTEGDVEKVARLIADELKKDAAQLPEVVRGVVEKEIHKIRDVVKTKGSMQLSFVRARTVMAASGKPMSDGELCDYMYTLRGGIVVGMAALKPMFVQYAARYAKPGDLSWLFFVGMDYHYGPFSSRNMMEQIRIRDLSDVGIPLDGDMLHYDETGQPLNRDSQTLRAAMKIFPATSRDVIFEAFLLEKDRRYIYTDLHRAIASAHRERFGETPFAVIGELMMGSEAWVKHGSIWKTRSYLNKLDRYLNSLPWDAGAVTYSDTR